MYILYELIISFRILIICPGYVDNNLTIPVYKSNSLTTSIVLINRLPYIKVGGNIYIFATTCVHIEQKTNKIHKYIIIFF